MEFTKNDIIDLIKTLKGFSSTYEVLIDFFEDHLKQGHFDFGLSNQGTQYSAIIIKEMEDLFPDVKEALFMPKENLPLFAYSAPDISQEYPIACWRLRADK